jgi:hypothetical protein
MKKNNLRRITPKFKREIQTEFDKGFNFSKALKKSVTLKKNSTLRKNFAVKALTEALLEGDKEAFQEIIIGYLGNMNHRKLAQTSKLSITTIRRVVAGSNYNLVTLLKITGAMRKSS